VFDGYSMPTGNNSICLIPAYCGADLLPTVILDNHLTYLLPQQVGASYSYFLTDRLTHLRAGVYFSIATFYFIVQMPSCLTSMYGCELFQPVTRGFHIMQNLFFYFYALS
jgi:hypothetical protein